MNEHELRVFKSLKSTSLVVAECMAGHPYIRGLDNESFVNEIRKIRPELKVSFGRIERVRRLIQNHYGCFVANGHGTEWRSAIRELKKPVHSIFQTELTI